jgi:hypothetical protein
MIISAHTYDPFRQILFCYLPLTPAYLHELLNHSVPINIQKVNVCTRIF